MFLYTSLIFKYFFYIQTNISNVYKNIFLTLFKSTDKFCCHSLVLILILFSIKTTSDNIFDQKSGTQSCLISSNLLTFQVVHQNKTCLSILEESKNDVSNPATTQPPNNVQKNNINFILRIKIKNIYQSWSSVIVFSHRQQSSSLVIIIKIVKN